MGAGPNPVVGAVALPLGPALATAPKPLRDFHSASLLIPYKPPSANRTLMALPRHWTVLTRPFLGVREGWGLGGGSLLSAYWVASGPGERRPGLVSKPPDCCRRWGSVIPLYS